MNKPTELDQTATYKKLPYSTIKPLLVHFELSEEAQAVIDPQMAPALALAHLRKQQLNLDAVNLLAYCLPRRESIWWACQCLSLRQAIWSSVQLDSINNAKQWLQQPAEIYRRRAEYHAKRLGSDCGPGWLALAVFWNGSGSIISCFNFFKRRDRRFKINSSSFCNVFTLRIHV